MKRKIAAYINKWLSQGYSEGIPDEAPSRLEESGRVPSYRHICKAIMKNDVALETLGYSRKPCALYNAIKRNELLLKGKIQPCAETQQRMF